MALLDNILGEGPGAEETQPLDLKQALARGSELLQDLKPISNGYDRGDLLVTVTAIYKTFSRRGWCPKSPQAVAEAFRRVGLAPLIRGTGGRGNASLWWLSEAESALNPRMKKRN